MTVYRSVFIGLTVDSIPFSIYRFDSMTVHHSVFIGLTV